MSSSGPATSVGNWLAREVCRGRRGGPYEVLLWVVVIKAFGSAVGVLGLGYRDIHDQRRGHGMIVYDSC